MPPAETRAVDVGTDPNRAQIMQHLAPRLNELAIFRDNGFQFEAHPGAYAPPPLVGADPRQRVGPLWYVCLCL